MHERYHLAPQVRHYHGTANDNEGEREHTQLEQRRGITVPTARLMHADGRLCTQHEAVAVRRGDRQCRDDPCAVGAYVEARRRVPCVVFVRVAVQPSSVAAASGTSGPVSCTLRSMAAHVWCSVVRVGEPRWASSSQRV